jgi:hypothetical protein
MSGEKNIDLYKSIFSMLDIDSNKIVSNQETFKPEFTIDFGNLIIDLAPKVYNKDCTKQDFPNCFVIPFEVKDTEDFDNAVEDYNESCEKIKTSSQNDDDQVLVAEGGCIARSKKTAKASEIISNIPVLYLGFTDKSLNTFTFNNIITHISSKISANDNVIVVFFENDILEAMKSKNEDDKKSKADIMERESIKFFVDALTKLASKGNKIIGTKL